MSVWLNTSPAIRSMAPRANTHEQPKDSHAGKVDGWNDRLEEDDLVSSNSHLGAPSHTRIPTAALLLTLNQISVMVSNGIDIAESLSAASKHCRHAPLAGLLGRCHLAVTQGVRFSTALAQEPAFPSHLTAMITAAEASGSMASAIRRAVQMLRAQQQLRSTIIAALIYPTILALASMIVMLALVFFVLPQFSQVFKSMGKPMPASTAMLLAAGQFAREHWYWFAGAIAGFGGTVYGLRNQPFVAARISWLTLYGPVLKQAYRPLMTGRMFSSLGSMLAGGVALLDAVRLTRDGIGNAYFRRLLSQIEQELISGNVLSGPISDAGFLPPEAIQMTSAAERTGRMADVFTDMGTYYEEEGSRQLKKLVHMIEPMVIMVMGGLVAGVVLSIMLPLLDLSSAT